jgi:hypothetical protein
LPKKSELTDQEAKVVEMKYKSVPVGFMTESEISKWGKGLLAKIHVITGWTIPNSPELLNILTDQFQKNLIEKYPMLNPDEIEYAFRHYGTGIEDWGKAMNLNLIDSVLSPYAHKRSDISEAERIVKTKKDYVQKIFTKEELEDGQREDAERQYQMFKKGFALKALEINKAILVKDGLMKEDEKVIDFFIRKIENCTKNIYVRPVQ